MAWRGFPAAKPGASPKYPAPAEVARYQASGTVRASVSQLSRIRRSLEARSVMATPSKRLRLSPPATSLPRATFTPSSSITRTGAMPEQRALLDAAQWTAVTPASRMASRSRRSEWTQWAISVPSFQRPNLA